MTSTVSTLRTAPPTQNRHNNWLRDFTLGIRLAVGGGRTSWTRLTLGTIGIGIVVSVLLVSASINHIMTDRYERSNGLTTHTAVINGVSPTQVINSNMSFQGATIAGWYVHGTGPNSPVPPGLHSLPGPDEIVLSPALANQIRSDTGLRARFPQKIVGTIGEAGLNGPADEEFYAGTGPLPLDSADGLSRQDVYSFGGGHYLPPTLYSVLVTLAMLAAVALLTPLFIFVSVSSRIAGAQRDRRQAAMRLVGAGAWQVRRIAAAESLVSAVAGLALGAVIFLGLRPVLSNLGFSFTDDVVPSPVLTVLIVLLVPLLTTGTVLFSMRRTIIEPLGVVRRGKPVQRQLWWRLTLIVSGVASLLYASSGTDTSFKSRLMAFGAAALLIGVPAILPWLLERIVGLTAGGSPSWQLAIRRLQLDSGTPARVVAGISVVLASTIAMQLVMLPINNQQAVPGSPRSNAWVYVQGTEAVTPEVTADLTTVPAAQEIDTLATLSATNDPSAKGDDLTIASCPTIEHILGVPNCVDGQGFLSESPITQPVKAGDTWKLTVDNLSGQPKVLGTYTVPDTLIPVKSNLSINTDGSVSLAGPSIDGVVLTPGAAAKANLPTDQGVTTWVQLDPSKPHAADQVENTLDHLGWQVVVGNRGAVDLTASQHAYATFRNLLNTGLLFIMLLAAISMLVLALEQVRERQRPLAVLASVGVPRSTVARSLLWQTAIPMVLGVAVAVGTGIGLAALGLRMIRKPLLIDWSTIGLLSAATIALVLLVTALTLPALRSAMRLSSLRTE